MTKQIGNKLNSVSTVSANNPQHVLSVDIVSVRLTRRQKDGMDIGKFVYRPIVKTEIFNWA